MNPPSLTDANGRPFPLARELARGGEGVVYTLPNDPTRLAKFYLKPQPVETAEKLAAMIASANPSLRAVTAWPESLLFHANSRQLAGFVMPRLVDCQPIQHLYNPTMRLKSFPRAGWAFQVRTALNLAAAFDEVHKAGYLVGDINQSNGQVLPQALVRLIDCDSFQVRANGKYYLCDVGTPHYTPPELQGKSLRGMVRTENHDRFGLAVLIFQLLFVGRHPYAGVYSGPGDPSFDEMIADFRFAHGPLAHTWRMAPPPHTPTFADIPPDVGSLFRRAFERGSESGTRPQPCEWLLALEQLGRPQNMAQCLADPGHTYWSGASGCVWCRLAARGGPEYYYGVAGVASAFTVDEARLQDVLRRLEALQPLEFPCDRERFTPRARPEPAPLPEDLEEHNSLSRILAVTAGLCVLGMPLGLIRGFLCVICVLAAIVFGTWFLILHLNSPWRREFQRRQRALLDATSGLQAVESRWDDLVRDYRSEHAKRARKLRRHLSECRGLTAEHLHEVQRLTVNAEEMARLRHLRLHQLTDAEIPQIGAGRKQLLAANNVFTAADIQWDIIMGIKGFGAALTGNLIAWKEEVLRTFRFDPLAAISPADQQAITFRFRARQQAIFSSLEQGLLELQATTPACGAALRGLEPELHQTIGAWMQADADLRLLHGEG